MVVEKVINNNIISAFDSIGKEVIVMGRGIGFGAKTGDTIDKSRVEKVFRIRDQDVAEQLKDLLYNMPLEHVQISNDIISYAKKMLGLELNQSIYVTLIDHINFAIERHRQGIHPENALLWEIRRFYNQEYQVGKHAVEIISERMNIALPDDEAGFIALHFINAEYCKDVQPSLTFLKLIERIPGIIAEEFCIELDEHALYYERLVTHVKFLFQRIYQKMPLPSSDVEFVKVIQHMYVKEYACAEKIAHCIQEEADSWISEEEKAYLTIHIRRIVIEER